MIDKETIKSNKLIAEFMGFKMIVEDYFGINIVKSPTSETYDLHGLKYHCSWDWLMPVLDKIERSGCIIEISYALVVTCRICVIGNRGEKAFSIINDNNGELPITAIYKSVVEYIEWNNKKLLTIKQLP